MNVSVFNGKSIFGLALCFVAFFAGDLLLLIKVGFVFQQTALTLSFGFLGLAFVMLGGIDALLEAIHQKSDTQVAANISTRDKKSLNNKSSDEIDNNNPKEALAKYKALSNKSKK